MERLTLTIDETAQALGISRTLAYLMVRDGRLPAIRLGGTWRVPRAALGALLAQASKGHPSPDEAA